MNPDLQPDWLLQPARNIMLATLLLALAGSLLGLTLGRALGEVSGFETWLVASSAVFSAAMVLLLSIRPLDRQPGLAAVTSAYFLAYLATGAVISLENERLVGSFLIYMLWFFPLMVFNRFVNLSRFSMLLSWSIVGAAIALAMLRIAHHPAQQSEAVVMGVYCLCAAAFVLLLEMFARYREHWIQARERERGEAIASRAIRDREQRFRRLFTNAAAGIGWLSPDGECQEVNRTFGAMLGYSSESIRGKRFGELVDAADYDRWQSVLSQLGSVHEQEASVELRLCGRGGRSVLVVLSFAVVRDREGAAEALAFVCLDNTRMRAMEARLQHSQRLEALGQLTGGIAHDFNNLLTVVLGNAELLESALADDSHEQRIAAMTRQAAERGARLVQQLLAFSRQQMLEPKTVRIDELLGDLEAILGRILGHDVEITRQLADDLWPARVDPVQLENALLNLCINARDAMPDGGRLEITADNERLADTVEHAGEETLAGDYIRISVRDSGSGIEPQLLPRLFEPFFTTKRGGKGAGLGLSMVYGFVRQSGGHIEIESEPGRGTEVRLLLPRASD